MWDRLEKWFETDEAAEVLSIEDPDLFVKVIEKAASINKEGSLPMWTDGNEILVTEKKHADMLHGALDRLFGTHCFGSGYYDPQEDIKEGCVDKYTGWWYVDIV